MGVATRVTMTVVVTTPLMVTPSLAFEPEPPPLPGTLTGTLLWSGTSIMGLTMLSVRGRDRRTRVTDRLLCTRANGDVSLHRPADQHDTRSLQSLQD
jgi:hypothetical protein